MLFLSLLTVFTGLAGADALVQQPALAWHGALQTRQSAGADGYPAHTIDMPVSFHVCLLQIALLISGR